LSVFKEKIDNVFLSDKFDFYSDYGKKDNVFKYDILSDDFSEIVDKNINNFIVFLNPYISSKNNEHYAIQPNVIKNNKKIKEQLKKCVQILKDKDKKFIFIFNSTKTDVYLEILKELLNTKDITPDILKINGLSLYGKEEGYLFLTNILVGCYGTK
jgi:predicted AlkP superfamily pyrophosphatase or phosphodiesterase